MLKVESSAYESYGLRAPGAPCTGCWPVSCRTCVVRPNSCFVTRPGRIVNHLQRAPPAVIANCCCRDASLASFAIISPFGKVGGRAPKRKGGTVASHGSGSVAFYPRRSIAGRA